MFCEAIVTTNSGTPRLPATSDSTGGVEASAGQAGQRARRQPGHEHDDGGRHPSAIGTA